MGVPYFKHQRCVINSVGATSRSRCKQYVCDKAIKVALKGRNQNG